MRKIRVLLPGESSTLPANERSTPRATFRRGQLSLQSNEIFGRTNPIPERSRRRANCAQAFVAGPAVFPLYFQRAVSWSERHDALCWLASGCRSYVVSGRSAACGSRSRGLACISVQGCRPVSRGDDADDPVQVGLVSSL